MIETKSYQLQEEIGRGGMGIVYRVWDAEQSRTIAMKVLSPDLSQDQNLRVLLGQQVRLLGKLHHPHILPIDSAGQNEEGNIFLVMPFASGGTLREKLHAGSFNLGQLLEAMHQVAQALDAAHQNRLFHGDLKPTNILFDDQGKALVADFGLAQVPNGKAISGTPGYSSPEAVAGEGGNGRSDQYSLAAIIYEALSGHLPTNELDPTQEPPPVNERNKDVSFILAALLEQALSRNPEERFWTVTDFIESLQAAASNLEMPLPSAKRDEAKTPIPTSVADKSDHSAETAAKLSETYEIGMQAMRAEDWAAAIDAFREVEEIDRHYRSVTILRRTCERSHNNMKIASQAKAQPVTPAPVPQQTKIEQTKQSIVEGAGGETSLTPTPRSISYRKFLIPVVLLLGLAIAFFAWQQTRQSAAVAGQETPESMEITASNAIQILTTESNAIWRTNEFDAMITNDFLVTLPQNAEVLSLDVFAQPVEFSLPDGTRIIAEVNTDLYFNSFAGWQDSEETSIVLESGKLIAISPTNVSIENPFGSSVMIEDGIAGTSFSDEEFRFDVDCLEGLCTVYGDLDGETILESGEHVFVGGSGSPSDKSLARYDIYASLPENIDLPTPTPTIHITETPTPIPPTLTATSTPTKKYTPTPTATPTETPTPTPQYIARAAPQITIFKCSQPGQFTPGQTIPFQWTWSGKLYNGEYLEIRIGLQGSSKLDSMGVVPSESNVTWMIDTSQFYQTTAYDYHWEIVHMAKNRRTVLARSVRGCLHIKP
ncbi:MAG: serine/threonine protein kinase [Chloroflexi bacterium]|nr:MAG: serine/threonine protein kinase [Chloroflexota bacterium]